MIEKIKSFFRKNKKLDSKISGKNQKEVKNFNLNEVLQDDLKKMLKFGKASNKIGEYESKPFIELPYGIVKKDLPAYQKRELISESVELIMQIQFPEFKIQNENANDVISFILWIKEQQEFLNEIEKINLHTEPEPEMLASGLQRLNDFGELVTIDALAKGNVLKYAEIQALPYFKVYEKLKLDKVNREIEKNYQKILEEKNKRR